MAVGSCGSTNGSRAITTIRQFKCTARSLSAITCDRDSTLHPFSPLDNSAAAKETARCTAKATRRQWLASG